MQIANLVIKIVDYVHEYAGGKNFVKTSVQRFIANTWPITKNEISLQKLTFLIWTKFRKKKKDEMVELIITNTKN